MKATIRLIPRFNYDNVPYWSAEVDGIASDDMHLTYTAIGSEIGSTKEEAREKMVASLKLAVAKQALENKLREEAEVVEVEI
jgi:hypothetical protein